MTQLSSPPLSTTTLVAKQDDVTNSDNQSQASIDDDEDDIAGALQNHNPLGGVVQNLGFAGGDPHPQIGQVSIEHSSDVHFGDKNIYHGAVSIKQIVYANGSGLVTRVGRDNEGYEFSEGDCRADGAGSFKSNENNRKCDKSNGGGEGDDVTVLRKGLKWLTHKSLKIGIFAGILLLFLVILIAVLLLRHPAAAARPSFDTNEQDTIESLPFDTDITVESQRNHKLRMVSRIEWVAQPPINDTTPLVTPVSYVIIHHTATENCSSIAQCVLHVRLIQTFHIDSKGFYDIGYNFLVGGDGAAYEGRGWTVEGAHLFGYNSRSIGIAFIGTFIKTKPPEIQILACKKLIQRGVELGYIREDYKIVAARQLAGTESPGSALFEDMQTWPHWTEVNKEI